jgi:hypothetical protein
MPEPSPPATLWRRPIPGGKRARPITGIGGEPDGCPARRRGRSLTRGGRTRRVV